MRYSWAGRSAGMGVIGMGVIAIVVRAGSAMTIGASVVGLGRMI